MYIAFKRLALPARVKGLALPRLNPEQKAHRHVRLPAEMVPVEGDGGVVEQRVLVKVAIQHGHCPSAALQRCPPDLQNKIEDLCAGFKVLTQDAHMAGVGHRGMQLCRSTTTGPCKALLAAGRHTSSDPCFQIRSPGTPRGSWLTAMSSSDMSTPRASFVICLCSAGA